MLNNYLKTTLRTLLRTKGSTFINVFGLAVGLACAVLIFLFVREERSYDRFHANADRIYRVTYEEINTPAMRHLPTVSPPMGPALAETYPEVDSFVRLRDPHRSIFAHDDTRFYESDFFYADSTFFDVFSFPLAQGNPETALVATNSVVLSSETARKYFGNENPLGQTLTMNDAVDLTVTGVLAPRSANSHLRFDFLVSFSTFRVPYGYPVTLDDWGWISFHTYVLLDEGADAEALEAKLPGFMRAHFDDGRAENVRLRLQPVTDIYLGELRHPSMAAGNAAYVYGLSGIAVLILLLACFNFTNLSTAHAIRRGKEVGVRKVLGAHRSQLVRQYLGESVFVALLGLLLAFILVEALAGVDEWLFGQALPLHADDYRVVLPLFLGIAWSAGVLAGSYPALVLSRFQPSRVLKGDGTASYLSGSTLRGTLIVLQFAIAVMLIAGSLIVKRQMNFVRQKDLGFEEEQVVALNMLGSELLHRYPELEERLRQNPHVVNVTKGGDMFDGDQGSVPIYPEGGDDLAVQAMNIYGMHYDFVETMGLEVLAGRAPSEAFPSDSADAVMLNRTAARIFAETVPGWDEPLGKALRISDIMEGHVIGVVDDFHFASLHTEIEPLVLYFPRALVDHAFVRVRPGNLSEVVASLERDWQAVAPDLPFGFTFLEDHIQQLYQNDQRFARLVTGFALLTILVACLGLYGLVAFVTQLRTKEIGIRKVLGASVPGIVALLSKQFLRYVLLANLVAWPLAYLGVQRWLDGFAYRIDVGLVLFIAVGLLTLAIAWLTMSYQSIRAALANPVQSLRYE